MFRRSAPDVALEIGQPWSAALLGECADTTKERRAIANSRRDRFRCFPSLAKRRTRKPARMRLIGLAVEGFEKVAAKTLRKA